MRYHQLFGKTFIAAACALGFIKRYIGANEEITDINFFAKIFNINNINTNAGTNLTRTPFDQKFSV